MSNDTPAPISDDEVVALARQILRQSREDIGQRAEQTPRELQQQQPGITIDLGHKNIVRLPDEVIDVIRAEIERYAPAPAPDPAAAPLDAGQALADGTDAYRLALSHNLLTTLPSRLIECKRLRYLNVRYNSMREIPEAVRPTRAWAEPPISECELTYK
jgi:Leucine-rich repeat (LRR) protein